MIAHATMRRPRAALVIVLIATAVGVPSAQQQAQPPVFRSGVERLPVEVTVVNGQSEAVRDLIASDFTVRLDGRPRRVLSAQWIPAATDAKSAAAPALPDGYVSNEQSAGGRLIILAIDQPNIPFGDMRPLRDAIDAFIDRLSRADRVAVVGFGTGAKSTTFISDHDQLKRALALLPGQQQKVGVAGGAHDLGLAAALAIDRGDDLTLSQVVARDCQGTQRAIAICRMEIQTEAQQVAAPVRMPTPRSAACVTCSPTSKPSTRRKR
jgi:VWFA-related protein